MVEPVDAMQRRERAGHRPLVSRLIGDGNVRDLSGSVVPGQDAITGSRPEVVTRIVGARKTRSQRAPPSGGIRLERFQVDDAAFGALPRAGYAERDVGFAVDVGERVAACVELAPAKRVDRAPIVCVHSRAMTLYGIADVLIRTPCGRGEAVAGLLAEEIRDEPLLARSKIQNAVSGRMPRIPTGKADVDVILVRHIRAVNANDVDVGGRGRRRVRLALLVWLEGLLIGMRARILAGDSRYRRVRENDGAVASDQIAPVESLAEQKGVVV